MEATPLTEVQKKRFEAKLISKLQWYGRGRRIFSWLHHLAVCVSIILCATAAVIPQLQGMDAAAQKNSASILAGLAAVILTVDVVGGFATRWRVFTLTEGKVDKLENELMKRQPTEADVDALNQIEEEHSRGIMGG